MTNTTHANQIPQSVLMVCLGNICRSPMAEEAFRQATRNAGFDMDVDSCGTAHWHEGNPADARSRKVAKARGYDIDHLTARQIKANDFSKFDLMLAMDKQNLADLQSMKDKLTAQGKTGLAELALFSEHDPQYKGQKVPDPYYGDTKDFEHALDLIESMADAWVGIWTS